MNDHRDDRPADRGRIGVRQHPGAERHAEQGADDHDTDVPLVREPHRIGNKRRGHDDVDSEEQRRRDRCGGTTVLASGTKISAAPKPENPRARPAMKAQAAIKTRAPVEYPPRPSAAIMSAARRRFSC